MNTLHQLRKLPVLPVILYFMTRMVFIFRYPGFNDEMTYLRYGKIMIDTSQHFYSLTLSGKQPLPYWLYGIAMHVFSDPIFAGRFVSLMFGLAALYGVYLLTRELYDDRIAYRAMILYVITPVFLFYDGLALVDNALLAIFMYICYVLILLWKRWRLRSIMWVAVLIAASLWIKTTGVLFAGIVTFLLCYFVYIKRMNVFHLCTSILMILATVILLTFPMVVHKEFVHLIRYQREYAMTISEILRFPLSTWWQNMVNALLVYGGYGSPFFLLVLVMSRKDNVINQKAHIIGMILGISLFFLVLTARSLHSRYILFSTIAFLPLCAAYLYRKPFVTLLAFGSMSILTLILAFDTRYFFHLYPQLAVFATDTYQYVDGWPSGYGVREAVNFVNSDRGNMPAFVGVRWDSGNPEDMVLVYAPLSGMEADYLDTRLGYFSDLVHENKKRRMYFITRNGQYGGLESRLTLLARYPKPYGKESVEVFRYTP